MKRLSKLVYSDFYSLARNFILSCVTLVGALAIPATSEAENRSNNSNIVVHVTATPIFPIMLKNKGQTEGEARLAVVVSETGKLLDWVAVDATHRDFVRAIANVIHKWRFEPARHDRIPITYTTYIDVEFGLGGLVVVNMDMGTSVNLFYDLPKVSDSERVRVYDISDLDTIPRPIALEAPVVASALIGSESTEAVFEFYIDAYGDVHIPVLREGDPAIDERILLVTQEALWKWKFEPPTVNGKAVTAKVAQRFTYRK